MTRNDLLSEVLALGTRLAHLEGWQEAHDREHLLFSNDLKATDSHVDALSSDVKWLKHQFEQLQGTVQAQGAQTKSINDLVTRFSWTATAVAMAASMLFTAVKYYPWLFG